MAITKVSDLDTIIQTLIAEARLTLKQKPVMRQLVTVMELPDHKGKAIEVPKLGTVYFSDLTEGVDMASPQTITDSVTTITPAEVGAQVIITDKAVREAPAAFWGQVAEVLGTNGANKLDTDLLALLDGFSVSLGSADATMTTGYLSAARARVKGNSTEPGPDPIFCVLHPYQYKDIVDDLAVAATYPIPEGISEEVMRNYYVGRMKIMGMACFEDGNITVDALDDAKGGVFSKSAIILAITREFERRDERDESLRAVELNMVAEYGYAEYQDAWGIEIYTDAAVPTS